jgi:hypothetical protein
MDRKTLILVAVLFGLIVFGMLVFTGLYSSSQPTDAPLDELDSSAVEPNLIPSGDRTSDDPVVPGRAPVPSDSTNEPQPLPTPTEPSPQNTYGVREITYTVTREGESNRYQGTFDLPNPCFDITPRVSIKESYPEQVEIDFGVVSNAVVCVEVIHTHAFDVMVPVSAAALVDMRINGMPAPSVMMTESES